MDSHLDDIQEDEQESVPVLSGRFKKLEDTLKMQIEQVEEELSMLNTPTKLSQNDSIDQSSSFQIRSSSSQLRHLQTYSSTAMMTELGHFCKSNLQIGGNIGNDLNNTNDGDIFMNNDSNFNFAAKTSRVIRNNNIENQNISAYWEQVMNFIRQGKDDEAVYALVRVVQRLIDEKATKKNQQEKASKSYVDSLYERVLGNVKENLMQQVEDSYDDLLNQVITITKQIGELKQFFQKELRDVTIQMAILKENNDTQNDLNNTSGVKNTSRSSGRSSSRAKSAFTVFSAKG